MMLAAARAGDRSLFMRVGYKFNDSWLTREDNEVKDPVSIKHSHQIILDLEVAVFLIRGVHHDHHHNCGVKG
jgi:hypothetical protein